MKYIKKFNENLSNSKNRFLSKDDIYEINDMLLDLKDEGLYYTVEYYVDNSDIITEHSGDWVHESNTNIEEDKIRSISISFIGSHQSQKMNDYYWNLVSNALNRIVRYTNAHYNLNIHYTKGITPERLPKISHNTDLDKSIDYAKNSSKGLIDICIFL